MGNIALYYNCGFFAPQHCYTMTFQNGWIGHCFCHKLCRGIAACNSGISYSVLHATFLAVFLFVSAPVSADITPSLAPARTSGAAPLTVFFDASGTTDTTTTRPFHDLEYTWDFGDTNAGTWKTGAQPELSKNVASGPVTAHVFETPGAYTVNLKVFNGTETVTTSTEITVADSDTVFSGTNTICFSNSKDPEAFADCPTAGKKITTSSFTLALSKFQGSKRRLLFRRGDTFTAETSARINSNGPGIVGAFGKLPAPPKVIMTGSAAILLLSSPSTPAIRDWRLMDLDFDGLGKPSSFGIKADGGINQLTILRMHIHNALEGIVMDGQLLDYANRRSFKKHSIFNEIAIVDSILTPITNNSTGWRIYIHAQHLSILGNMLGNTDTNIASGSHLVRTPNLRYATISNNTFSKPVGLMIKMHAPTWCKPDAAKGINGRCNTASTNHKNSILPYGLGGKAGGYTERIIISENKFIGGSAPYLVNLGPQNSNSDERVRNIIVERNWFQAADQHTRSALVISGSEITVRNNICELTGGSSGRYCVDVKWNGATSPAPPPDYVRIYNNTAYSGDANQEFAAVYLEPGISNIMVYNNLAYAPLAKTSVMISNLCGASCFLTAPFGNSTDYQVKNISPLFTATPPAHITDWKLSAGSYAINHGTNIPVWSDLFFTRRPQDSKIDIGAAEH